MTWLLLVYGHTALEWLFQATKVSFLSFLSPTERLWILWLAPLPVVLAGWLAMAGLALPTLGAQRVARVSAQGPVLRAVWIAARLCLAVLPATLLTATVFLLVDNFTLTVFGFGSLTQRGHGRQVYGVLLHVAWALALLLMLDRVCGGGSAWGFSRPRLRKLGRLGGGLLAISVCAWLLVPWKPGLDLAVEVPNTPGTDRLPDIFVLSAEALPASAFDLYSARDPADSGTQPALDALGAEGVVFENAFANADRTAGSVPSVVTGRYPTSTRKLNGRHQLRGIDSYRHLPGILQQLGYRTYLNGPAFHVDPVAWNLRRGFDLYNDRPLRLGGLDAVLAAAGGRLDSTVFFLELMGQRLRDRWLHSVGSELAPLPTQPYLEERPGELFSGVELMLRESDAPLFVMAHLMGNAEMQDLYVRRLLDLHDTARSAQRDLLFVFWSDHGPGHDARVRLPLVIRFPAWVETAALDAESNAQNLDIPPTVLDAVGVAIPEWMEGRSLLRDRSPLRPILITSSDDQQPGLPLLGVAEGGPRLQIAIVCQRLWQLDLLTGYLAARDFEDHTVPCATSELPTTCEIRGLLLQHLRERGYPVDLIPVG